MGEWGGKNGESRRRGRMNLTTLEGGGGKGMEEGCGFSGRTVGNEERQDQGDWERIHRRERGGEGSLRDKNWLTLVSYHEAFIQHPLHNHGYISR